MKLLKLKRNAPKSSEVSLAAIVLIRCVSVWNAIVLGLIITLLISKAIAMLAVKLNF